GRFLGFSAIGTAVLLVMGVIGYLFVYTGLRHEHVVRPEQVEQLNPGSGNSLAARGRTSFNKYHAHDFTIDENGEGQTELEMGHTHRVRAVREGDKVRYEVGPHEGMLLARVPLYGKLRFLDRQGRPAEKGVNVGNEWTYRSYIEGKTNSTAIWNFSGVSENYFVPNADGDPVLPLELSLSVFRTFKGNIEETVLGEMVFVNPNPRAKIRRSEPITFRSKEYVRQELPIKRKTRGLDADGRLVDCDLYNDLFVDGQVEIHVKCGQPAQYFGMAQPDLFVQGPEQPFWRNFIKGYVSIWLQMMMVTSLGVMFSTFLSGSVSLLSTVVSVIFGFFEEFVLEKFNGIFQGPEGFKRFVRNLFGIEESIGGEGGGLFESIIRIARQLNLTADLEIGFAEHIVKFVDMALILMLRLLLQVFPDFSRFDNSNYVAYGFNVDGNLLLIQTTTALAFTVCTSIIGYFFLKTRELAA
ncbi:MAG TPA: hypothetical protein PLV92_05105, partial [Pirellulaceae bacterium]|nr:hypothetical protein [Pirellulaceae bacterium]